MAKKVKKGLKVALLTAEQAVQYIEDDSTIAFHGAGGGICEPTSVIDALAERYHSTGSPKNLTYYHATGLGDRNNRGMSPLAQPGMVKRVYGGHWAQSPRIADMAQRNEIEAYNFPQGILTQLLRCSAAKQPGILSRVGLGTFIDPRQSGGRLNEVTTQQLVQLTVINEDEYLFYPAVPIDVAIIRASSADTEGYLTMEDEVTMLDALAMAQAAHNNGGLVIAQVKRVVEAGSLPPKQVKIPGLYVDIVVEDAAQTQMYHAEVDRFVSGDFRKPDNSVVSIALNERKVIARRALMEIQPGDIGNVGVGIADGIGIIAKEEGIEKNFTLTVETGAIGGVTAQGIFFGASINMKALVDMPTQFDFYDGGGLDVCFLSFAEMDKEGNVNVHKFNGKIVGTGGFVNICQSTKKVVFCGTLKAGGLQTAVKDKRIFIEQEGRFCKLIDKVNEITFGAKQALKQGQQVLYITERAVFELTTQGVVLTEIAPGMDLEKDIISNMGFRPLVSKSLKTMDERLFDEKPMGLSGQAPWNETIR